MIAAAEVIEIAQSVTMEMKGKGRTKTSTTIRSAAATPDGGERMHQRSKHSSRQEKRHAKNQQSGRSDGQSKEKGRD